MHRMSVLAAPLVTVIILLGATTSYAQLVDTSSILSTPTLVNGVLTIGTTTLQPDEASTQEELPGLGHKFELLGAMIKDTDPENAYGKPGHAGGGAGGNEVISADIVPGTLAFAWRWLTPGIDIRALTNQIGFKYYFVAPRTCFAATPRIQLLIDTNGDGSSDFTAHGHVNPLSNYTACPMNKWIYEDLTDDLPRWEVTGAAVPGIVPNVYMPWKPFADAIAALPSHRVLAGMLFDGESCGAPSALACGKAYYDLLTIENRTLEIWHDAVRK